jgi:hypothetical protein
VVDAGRPRPPKAWPVATQASCAKTLAVFQPLQRDGYLPGLIRDQPGWQTTAESAQPGSYEHDARTRINAAIGEMSEVVGRAVAAREGLMQERSNYTA